MNHYFFHTWSSDMAYILGFVMADGSIRHKDYCKTQGYSLAITLQLEDKEILNFIKEKICTNANVNEYKWTGSDGIYREQCSLTITSKILVEKLMEYGVVPQKTGKETFPNIPPEFENDFIRGYFDGDGCIMVTTQTCNGKEYPMCMFKLTCANKQFLEICKQKMPMIKNQVRYHGNNCYILETRNRKDMFQIRDYIYSNNGFSLKRKKNKFYSVPELKIRTK